jgi:hypothetical protein
MKRLAALALLAVLPLATWAADPPGRVARLSLVEGEAAVFVDPEQGWEGARINTTLTSENSVWTEPGARAEVRFGATALRLGEATQLDILRLDDQAFRAHVARGSLTVRIHEFDKGESFFVSTGDARFHVGGNGRYRIDADPGQGESRLTVFTGSARLEVAGGTIIVDTGRSVRVTGGERPRFEFETAYSTSLDEWALARDQRWAEREAARYVPRQMTGWEDLDDYGSWRNDPEYGAVWFPTRVEAGWAPYRYGRWTWVRPWGWTWVDDAPWGYAPFHYGRWIYVGNRWGWYPGRYTARPIWAPALVGWIGGSGWSISISSGYAGALGWYPLSPYDLYEPWYPVATTYVTYVNRIVLPPRHHRDRGRDRNDGRDYRHEHRERGATVVPRDQFGSQRPVQSIRAAVPSQVVAAQPIVSGAAVLPPRAAAPARERPAQSAPVVSAPATGRPAPTPMPSFPADTPRGTTVQNLPSPAPGQPAVPVSRLPQSAPAAPTRAAPPAERPAQPAPRPAPSYERPSQPAAQAAPPAGRAPTAAPRTTTPVERSSPPAAQPAPARTAPPVQRTSPPVAQPAPAAPARTAPPVQRASPPVAQPAPAATARPAAPAAPAAPAEKPARGGEAPAAASDKPGRGKD